MKRLVLLGAPGCGKGTQAARLAADWEVPAISTGEMLRGAVEAGSELGKRVEGIMASGKLVDDATMADVVLDRLGQADAREGFVLDGYPRTAGQAGTLDGILREQAAALDAVVFIDVPESTLVERALARRRADDSEEVIRERLGVYRRATEPLVDLYKSRGLVHEVDGSQTIDRVTAAIKAALGR